MTEKEIRIPKYCRKCQAKVEFGEFDTRLCIYEPNTSTVHICKVKFQGKIKKIESNRNLEDF